MKNILIPIDFSRDSMNALGHSVNLANNLGANLRLIHVRKNKDYDQPFVIEGTDSSYGKTVEDFCRGIVATYRKDYMAKGSFDFVVTRNKIYKGIIDQAAKDNTDIIMMGTHGVSGFEEFWLGSNSYRVVSKAPCPVWTVRHGFKQKTLKKIVVPIDAHRETRHKLPFTTELAKTIGAEIHVVDVRSTNRTDIKKRLAKYADQAVNFVKERGVKTIRDSKYGSNIADVTISYAVHVGADLISIVSNQKGTPSKMHLSTTAQQMVNHSPIPILSIQPTF
ncbi:MAG: universal stress protein [Bacteroidales bacterium]|nr:MAG: universal stress protein [Bacteroidales bacterium]